MRMLSPGLRWPPCPMNAAGSRGEGGGAHACSAIMLPIPSLPHCVLVRFQCTFHSSFPASKIDSRRDSACRQTHFHPTFPGNATVTHPRGSLTSTTMEDPGRSTRLSTGRMGRRAGSNRRRTDIFKLVPRQALLVPRPDNNYIM